MLLQILNLTWKELTQLRRDRLLLLFLILEPTLQLVLLSRNTARGITDLSVAVLDLDQSALSRELISTIDTTEEMQVLYFPTDRKALTTLLDDGKVKIGIIIPTGFARHFFGAGPRPAQLQALVDGTNVLVGANAGQVIEGVVAELIKRHFAPPLPVDLGGIEVQSSALFNPTFNAQWFAIPAQLAFITYQVALVVAATGFVREKELGTLEQLVITPIRRSELILGKALPSILIGIFNFALLLAVQTLGYGVPVSGSLGLLMAMATIFIIAMVGMGTLISVLAQNQQQAILLVFLLAILEVTISGYLVPVDNMPWIMHGLAEVSALQHFMAIMRAVSLRGATLAMVQVHALALLLIALVTNAFAWRAFTRTV